MKKTRKNCISFELGIFCYTTNEILTNIINNCPLFHFEVSLLNFHTVFYKRVTF